MNRMMFHLSFRFHFTFFVQFSFFFSLRCERKYLGFLFFNLIKFDLIFFPFFFLIKLKKEGRETSSLLLKAEGIVEIVQIHYFSKFIFLCGCFFFFFFFFKVPFFFFY
ncbi:hypothetical protein HMI54_015167 [Coelomomyces lativittatus]|nr:hypothetical protein HMI54_015167 [Coelomomyces lativittatus]